MFEKVMIVSWPRSGQHLVQRFIQDYYDLSEENYCEYYGPMNANECCGNLPCTNKTKRIIKSHDFEQELPIDLNIKKIILTRRAIPSIISYFQLCLKLGDVTDTRYQFYKFYIYQRYRLFKFEKKWKRRNLNNLVISYEEIVRNPISSFQEIVSFLNNGEGVDEERLAKCINNAVGYTYRNGKKITSSTILDRNDYKNDKYYSWFLF